MNNKHLSLLNYFFCTLLLRLRFLRCFRTYVATSSSTSPVSMLV